MDKRAKIGYSMTLEEAMKFWTRCQEAEKALGEKLNREEREKLLIAMQLGKELSLEDLREMMAGKKVLIVKDKNENLVCRCSAILM
jgi:hypothetical protein